MQIIPPLAAKHSRKLDVLMDYFYNLNYYKASRDLVRLIAGSYRKVRLYELQYPDRDHFRFIVVFRTLRRCRSMGRSKQSLAAPGIWHCPGHEYLGSVVRYADAWGVYLNPNGAELSVENGIYRAYTPNPGYLWGLNTQEHTDVVEEVEITPLDDLSGCRGRHHVPR